MLTSKLDRCRVRFFDRRSKCFSLSTKTYDDLSIPTIVFPNSEDLGPHPGDEKQRHETSKRSGEGVGTEVASPNDNKSNAR